MTKMKLWMKSGRTVGETRVEPVDKIRSLKQEATGKKQEAASEKVNKVEVALTWTVACFVALFGFLAGCGGSESAVAGSDDAAPGQVKRTVPPPGFDDALVPDALGGTGGSGGSGGSPDAGAGGGTTVDAQADSRSPDVVSADTRPPLPDAYVATFLIFNDSAFKVSAERVREFEQALKMTCRLAEPCQVDLNRPGMISYKFIGTCAGWVAPGVGSFCCPGCQKGSPPSTMCHVTLGSNPDLVMTGLSTVSKSVDRANCGGWGITCQDCGLTATCSPAMNFGGQCR